MSDCAICAVIATEGWNATPWHHCPKCHKRWTGLNKAHCMKCHETFSTYAAADRHWTRRGHVHPSEVEKLCYSADRLCWQYRGPDEKDGEWRFGR